MNSGIVVEFGHSFERINWKLEEKRRTGEERRGARERERVCERESRRERERESESGRVWQGRCVRACGEVTGFIKVQSAGLKNNRRT